MKKAWPERASKQPSTRAAAFTMVELLVVIAIIGILVTLSVVALAPLVESARVTATRALIAQIDEQLQRRLAAFNALDEEFSKVANYLHQVAIDSTNHSRVSRPIAEVIVRKARYLQEFPQRIEDLRGMDFDSGTLAQEAGSPIQVTRDSPLLSSLPSPILKQSSSELLYLLLTSGPTLGNETYQTDQIDAKHLVDSDNDGLMEIVDAWGNELRFYNAPTSLFRPDPSVPDPDLSQLPALNLNKGARVLFHDIPGDDKTSAVPPSKTLRADPFDQTGVLSPNPDDPSRYPWSWLLRGHSMPSVGPENYYHPSTFFSYLIVSAGPDKELGLDEPETAGASGERLAHPTNVDQILDNISNHQR